MNSGRRDQAEQDFLRLVRVERDSGIGYYYLAEIQHQSGRNQDAAASLRKALEIMPGFPPAQLLWDRISGIEDLPGEFHDRN
jgi:tetratricopeptide (TPR) repeat protein